jgi:hypothetical protein
MRIRRVSGKSLFGSFGLKRGRQMAGSCPEIENEVHPFYSAVQLLRMYMCLNMQHLGIFDSEKFQHSDR